MGSKKRSSNLVEDEEAQPDKHTDDNVVTEPLKNTTKKRKGNEVAGEDEDAKASIPDSVKPMERRKKRKAEDKVRRNAVASENEQSESIKIDETKSAAVSSSNTGVLPEFHISVFKELASVDASVREKAVESLVTELQEIQKAYEGLENKGLVEAGSNLEAEKNDGLDNCAPSLRYALHRLVRGVSSSRECARQGFALGLTLLVATIPSIKVDSLLKLVDNLLEISSSMKGQEVKDCLLGRLFAYGAIARSGRLKEGWNSDANNSHLNEFCNLLISLAAKKRYLQEPAVSVLLDLIEMLPTETPFNHIFEAPGIRKWFEEATEVGNPDALLLALKLWERVSDENATFGKLLPSPFSPNNFFSADHLSTVVNCLKESTFCQPRIHTLWPVLANMLLNDVVLKAEDAVSISSSLKKHKKTRKSGSSDEEIVKNIQNFVGVVIEGSLLLSSHDRKHLAFDVLLLLFPRLSASFVSILLSYKVVQCLMDILSTKDSWLYKVAQNFLKELSDWVGEDDVRRVAVIVALQKHGGGKFDCITRTKTVKDLMTEFKTESGCMLFIQNLMNMFVDECHISDEPSDQSQTTDDNSEAGSVEDKDSPTVGNFEFLRTWVVESLPSILKHLKLEPEAKFRVQKEVSKFLVVQGMFTASLGTEVTSFELQEKFRWPKVATSSSLCIMCIEQLQLLLANSQKGEGSKGLSNGVEPNDLGSYCMRFLSTLRSIPSVSLFRRLSDEDEEAFEKLQEMEMKLCRVEKNAGLSADANKLHALRYLLVQLLLQVLLQPGEFAQAASELVMCCKIAFASSDLLGSSGEEDEPNGEDVPPALLDVLVDTLLSLLPQSSAPTRSASEQVFKYFCEEITDDGLLRMLKVVTKTLKPPRRQLAKTDDEDDDDFLDVEEEEEEIDEAETVETGESDEQTDESEAIVGGVGDIGKEVLDTSDDSDGGMDDDDMFRMDTYLAQIFKEKKNQAGGETAQSQLLLFKLRVLSLLEIYLHENPGKPQVLLVYSNLAQAFVSPHIAEGSEQLGQRIWGILQKKVFKAKEYPKGESVQLDTLESLLEKNLKLASKPFKKKKSTATLSKKKQAAAWNRHKMITSFSQNSTFWILKIIDSKNLSGSELLRVYDILKSVLVEYLDSKKSQIKSEFLKEMIRRRPWIGHHLFSFLLEKCGDSKSDFRRVEVLDLVIEILKSLVPTNSSNSNQLDVSKKIIKTNMHKLCHLIKELLTNMPEKQARRAEVRKFCTRVFQIISAVNLVKVFLKNLPEETRSACETQLGEQFLNLKEKE